MTIRINAPHIVENDAVGNFCCDLAGCLRKLGYDVALYADYCGSLSGIANIECLFSDIEPDDILLTSYSIFDQHLPALLDLPQRKLCYFHGVTPPELLVEFDPYTAEFCRKSQAQFPMLAGFDCLIANSRYTADGLQPYVGTKEISHVPPVFASSPLLSEDVEAVERWPATLLMVGRVIPHKHIEAGLAIAAAVRQSVPQATLIIAGKCLNQDYRAFLDAEIVRLKLPEGSVQFTGAIAGNALRQHYGRASAFLCTSLHEGFCIPVLEAMRFSAPVFVQSGNAAAEVVGDAGIIFAPEPPERTAQRIISAWNDPHLPQRLTYARQRADALLADNSPDFWHDQLAQIMHPLTV